MAARPLSVEPSSVDPPPVEHLPGDVSHLDDPPIDLVRARLARIAAEAGLVAAADDHTHVRPEQWHDEVLARADEAEALLPVPGRHAFRREASSGGLLAAVRRRAPTPVGSVLERFESRDAEGAGGGAGRGGGGRRVGIGPPQLAVLAVLVAVALAATCWWVLAGRASEQTVEPLTVVTSAAGTALTDPSSDPSPDPSPASADAPATDAGEGAPASTGEVVVHVAGRVVRPGIVVLPVGSRVADAVEAAGGPVPDTDLTGVNLARPLVDGEQVLVGVDPADGAPAPPPSAGGAGTSPGGAPGAAPGGLVDLNTADLAALDLLPGVGPVTAQAILDWRDENGGFSHVDELLEVKGIGEATLAELAPLVTV
ncbi:MAG TPA: ComEA family DNA-binding protein [Nocardioides sp.]